jgi:hypothetical protein
MDRTSISDLHKQREYVMHFCLTLLLGPPRLQLAYRAGGDASGRMCHVNDIDVFSSNVDPTLVTALTLNPVTSPVPMGQTITTVTFTCATTGCQGDGSYLKAAWAPTGQCSTAAKREMEMFVTTAAKSVPNVVLHSNQVYKLCWCAPIARSFPRDLLLLFRICFLFLLVTLCCRIR